MGFQTQVNLQPAPAVAGDFASANPRWNVLAGPGGLVAGAFGVTVGRFAWVDPANGQTVNNFGTGAPSGFVHREQQALITTYLAESSNLVRQGFDVTLMSGGDFWVKNDGSNAVTVGMKAYANYATGQITFNATGTPPEGAVTTGSIAASTFSVTASIADQVMTVTAVGSGTVVAGATISGTSVTSGTTVVEQLTGTAGGIGTYAVSVLQATPSTTVSGSYGTFTVTAVASGSVSVGDVLSGSNVTGTPFVTQILTGSGGVGTYAVSVSETAASATVNATSAVETKWLAASVGYAGELIKMSSHLLG